MLTALQKSFFNSIEKMIADKGDKYMSQKLLGQMTRDRTPYSTREEHRTLKISLPRRRGNTTIALELFKKHPNSFLIFSTRVQLDDVRVKELLKKNRGRIFSAGMSNIPSSKIDLVIFDTNGYKARMGQLDRIYGINANFFVFLG